MNKFIFSIFFLTLFLSCSKKDDVFEIARHGKPLQLEKIVVNDRSILNSKNQRGYTPLILACYYNNSTIVNYLINKQVNIDETSNLGTALMAATYKGNTKIATQLINANANVNLTDDKGTTALHYACFTNNKKLVALLLENGAHISMKDAKGKTPLDIAIDNNYIEILQIIQTKTD